MESTQGILGVLPIERRIEIEENIRRKNFTQSELAEVQEEMRRRLEEQFPRGRKAGTEKCQNLGTLGVNRVDEAIGDIFGESRETVRKRREVVKASKEDPGNFSGLVEEMDKRGSIDRAYRRLEVTRRMMTPQPTFPQDKYAVILADPPWQYANSGLAESAESHYRTMPLDEICALAVNSLATERSVLFLWSPNPLVPDALKVLEAWGFIYKTYMAWIKDRGPSIGWFLKSKHETLLIGTRKETPHPLEKPDSYFKAKREGIHSRKPKVAYEIIESMYPGPRIELFARQMRKGWAAWGLELSHTQPEDCRLSK